jgi:hypothetical protein
MLFEALFVSLEDFMRMNFLVKVLMRVLGATIVAAGLAYQAQTSSGEEGSGKNPLAPPDFPKGVGEGSEIYERLCKKPAEGKHYKTCVIETNQAASEVGAAIGLGQGSPTGGISGGAES